MSDFEQGFREELEKLARISLPRILKPWETFAASRAAGALERGAAPSEQGARALMGTLEEGVRGAQKAEVSPEDINLGLQELLTTPEGLKTLKRQEQIRAGVGTGIYGGAGLAGGGTIYGLTRPGEPQV
jgi:hypothetical protein